VVYVHEIDMGLDDDDDELKLPSLAEMEEKLKQYRLSK
jgi:hypothetical protein